MSQYNLELIPREVENQVIYQRASDGYVNATAMCKAAGKLFADYSRSKNTQAYLQALSSDMGIPISEIVQVIKGGEPHLQGTWVHPDIAVHLAQWCSPKFAVQVNRFIREWMQGETAPQKELASWQHFHDRVDITSNSVPNGYFGIFHEIAGMIVPMIRQGVILDQHTIPDISVGKIWSNHWKKNKLYEVFGERRRYPHEYPEYYAQAAAGEQEVWCYPEEALGEFRRWLREQYQLTSLPAYISSKQKKGHIEPNTANKLIDTFAPKQIKK